MTKLSDNIIAAAKARSDLNLFASIVVLLESGLNHSPTHAAAERIISIAKREQQKCLQRYDSAMAKAGAGLAH